MVPRRDPAGPIMAHEIEYRDRPKHNWETIGRIGGNTGAFNAGIFKVRTASDTQGRVFAEKRFAPKDIQSKMAYKEIKLLFQIGDHPNITGMIDHFVDERSRKASIYLEYCDAGTLLSVVEGIRAGKIVHEDKIWSWFLGMMEGLVYCHRGPNPEDAYAVFHSWSVVLHRDIKPPNVLLKSEGGQIVAKLADFGCAISGEWSWCAKSRGAQSRTSIGTRGFDAPEAPRYEGRTDLWQLALTMMCVCNGIINPCSRQNPRGERWDKQLPAGKRFAPELSQVLMVAMTEDIRMRPDVLPLLQLLKEKYGQVKQRLPIDPTPLEIFITRAGGPRQQVGLRHPRGRGPFPGWPVAPAGQNGFFPFGRF